MTLFINGKTYEADELIAYVKKLEQENAELKTKNIPQLERRIASIRGSHRVDIKKLNARIEQVERLEKENAELKSIADFQQSGNMSRYFELKRQAEKLEEAKELLKQWLQTSNASSCDNINIVTDTEQFISEVEK